MAIRPRAGECTYCCPSSITVWMMPLIEFMNHFLPFFYVLVQKKREVSQKSIFVKTLRNHWCLSTSHKISEISSPNDLLMWRQKESRYCREEGIANTHLFPQAEV